jgi:hypothetical protein
VDVTTVTFSDIPVAWVTERQRATNGHARPARRPVLVVLAGIAVTVARFSARHLPRWSQVRTAVMATAAFVMLTVAAWGVDWRLGLAVGAVCVLVAELLTAPAKA